MARLITLARGKSPDSQVGCQADHQAGSPQNSGDAVSISLSFLVPVSPLILFEKVSVHLAKEASCRPTCLPC